MRSNTINDKNRERKTNNNCENTKEKKNKKKL